jgi:hypothetical protein
MMIMPWCSRSGLPFPAEILNPMAEALPLPPGVCKPNIAPSRSSIDQVFEFVGVCETLTSVEAIMDSIGSLVADLGFSSVIVTSLPLMNRPMEPLVLLSCWPRGWVERDSSQNYFEMDASSRELAAAHLLALAAYGRLRILLGDNPPARRKLTPREREVLAWASAGKSAWETSVLLGISEATAITHLDHNPAQALRRQHHARRGRGPADG